MASIFLLLIWGLVRCQLFHENTNFFLYTNTIKKWQILDSVPLSINDIFFRDFLYGKMLFCASITRVNILKRRGEAINIDRPISHSKVKVQTQTKRPEKWFLLCVVLLKWLKINQSLFTSGVFFMMGPMCRAGLYLQIYWVGRGGQLIELSAEN